MNDLRLDYFIREELKLYQHKNHFHFNTDTKLLAQFAKVKKDEIVLDIGTNNGALLMWFDQYNVKKLIGVEVLEESFKIAQKNVDEFFNHETLLINKPIQEVNLDLVDVIVSNPPYFTESETHPNIKMDMRQLGRVEVNLSLEELIQNANRLLKSNGRFYFVHRCSRIHEIFDMLSKYKFKVKSVAIAYDSRTNESKSLLIEAIKEGQCKCQILPAIMI